MVGLSLSCYVYISRGVPGRSVYGLNPPCSRALLGISLFGISAFKVIAQPRLYKHCILAENKK